jgi:hypothetical protein
MCRRSERQQLNGVADINKRMIEDAHHLQHNNTHFHHAWSKKPADVSKRGLPATTHLPPYQKYTVARRADTLFHPLHLDYIISLLSVLNCT